MLNARMRTEIDLNESENDLNECEHFLVQTLSLFAVASLKASSHKIVKQSQTVGNGSGTLNLIQLSRSTQTVAGSLRSLRVYVNKIGDCLPRCYVN